MLHEERRRYPRLQVAVQVEIRPEGISVPTRLGTTDLSLGGCSAEMVLALDVGTKLDIVVWLDGHKVSKRRAVARPMQMVEMRQAQLEQSQSRTIT